MLATGDAPLFEYDTRRGDQYWAIDKFGFGKNMLGLILMEVREVLKEDVLFAQELKDEMNKCPGCQAENAPCLDHRRCSTPSDLYLTSLIL